MQPHRQADSPEKHTIALILMMIASCEALLYFLSNGILKRCLPLDGKKLPLLQRMQCSDVNKYKCFEGNCLIYQKTVQSVISLKIDVVQRVVRVTLMTPIIQFDNIKNETNQKHEFRIIYYQQK